MRLFSLAWRGFFFFLVVFGFASSLGYVVARQEGALGFSALVALIFLVAALRWKRSWVKELRARRVQVLDGIEVYYLNDTSSHVFIMASPLGRGGAIFMTRGVLSLLDPEELEELMNASASHLHEVGLGWETFLSCLQLRLLQALPLSVRKLFYSGESMSGGVSHTSLFRSLPALGLLDLVRRSYLPEVRVRSIQLSRKRLVFERLLAESLICQPQLSSAIAPHSLVSPWPRAILRTGRPCLPGQASLTSLP